MSDEHVVYVRVNHANMVVVDKVKTPKLFDFLEKNIEEIMTHVSADFKKMEQHYQRESERDPNKPIDQLPKYKAQVPVAHVTLRDFVELQEGIKIKPIKSMTLCFGPTRLLCDIRVKQEDMIKSQLQKLHERGLMGAPDPNMIPKKAPLRIILPEDQAN